MSVLNQSGEEQVECPLCMEPLEVDDLHFYPCTCGYQICRFCWNRIREGENGRCPACRKAYPENPADFTPLSQEQVAAIKIEKRAREQKRRNKTLESRRALANVRVVQKNLVFVVGLPVRLADPEILKRQEYFGKYGKIHKVVINQSTTYAGSQGPSASAYVTYVAPADALRAIQGVNNVTLDGRVLKGSLGTTKYCANFMKNQPCPKPDCMYLHELGDPDASFTKEEMHAGLHQAYERRLHEQLLAQTQREQISTQTPAPPPQTHSSTASNSSSNSEKSSSKDGSQSKFIPTTVITSSHINNIINSTSKSKKESNGTGSNNGSSGGNSNTSSSNSISNMVGSKEAWPSLGSSPPTDTPQRKQPSPSQSSIKSQENGTSDSNSHTQQQAQTKNNKEQSHTDKTNSSRQNKESNVNQNGHRKNKQQTTDSKCRQQQHKQSNGTNDNESEEKETATEIIPQSSVFETDSQRSYLTNELDELESDRHSLLETHDLLENSDHSLLEDDNNHSLLDDANSDVLMMQRHREMLAGLVDSNHLMKTNGPVNGYALLDNNMYLGNERQISQIYQNNIEKELMMRERNREMMMRQNELMARQALMDKHYMPQSSIGLESANELLGANYHNNASLLTPFGVRTLGGAAGGVVGTTPYAMQPRLLPRPQPQLVNGYDATAQQQTEGRYLAENMDKFFTDFHKTQQMRLLLSRGGASSASAAAGGVSAGVGVSGLAMGHYESPRHMLSAERLELDHKQRAAYGMGMGTRCGEAAGDADDDLDFDPFKETQKALAEMIENENMHTNMAPPLVSGGDGNLVRSRLPPPGFSHMNAFGVGAASGVPRPPHHPPHPAHQAPPHHHGFRSTNAMYSDWTQMDPAIMSTSVNFPKVGGMVQGGGAPAAGTQSPLSQQQQEVFARFNQMNVGGAGVNGLAKSQPAVGPWGAKLGWTMAGAPFGVGVPLPPGFAPAKPPAQRPTECIDAN